MSLGFWRLCAAIRCKQRNRTRRFLLQVECRELFRLWVYSFGVLFSDLALPPLFLFGIIFSLFSSSPSPDDVKGVPLSFSFFLLSFSSVDFYICYCCYCCW